MTSTPWYQGDARLAAAVRAQREGQAPPRPEPVWGAPTRDGFTYLVGAEGQQLVKIGRTSGSPRARMATMQTGSPVRLYLLATLPHPRWEDVLHHHFAAQRRSGEWFALDVDQVAAVMRWACESAFPDVERAAWDDRWPTEEEAHAAGWDHPSAALVAVFGRPAT